MNRIPVLPAIWHDAVHTMRTLRRTPAFTVAAVLTLAVAIGGNTAMFTVIHAVLLKPLEYRDSDRLVHISGGATPTRFAEMQAEAHSFTGLAAYTGDENLALTGRGEPEVLKGVHVSAGFLQILDVHPVCGRSFLPQEDTPGGAPVAMIGYELWQRRFAGDPRVIGKMADFAATSYTVIGVLPPRFRFPFPGVDVWMTVPSEWSHIPPKSRPLTPFLTVFGRLKTGVGREEANAEMKVIHRQYAIAHPAMLDARPKTPQEVTPMKDDLVRNVRSMLWMLVGAVGLVLLIACANIGGLLLARAAYRSREFAVRAALGAARTRLIAQLLVESVVISFAGGTLGVVLAFFGLRAISNMTAFDLPRLAEIHLDWMVLGFAAVLSLATGVLFGLAPSIGASRTDLMSVLRASGEGALAGAPRTMLSRVSLRTLLSVGQVALSIVLLIGALLLMESVAHLRGIDVGFNPAKLLTMEISLPPTRYDTDQKKALFFQRLVAQIESLPGVRAATAAMSLPMSDYAGIPVQDAAKPPLKLNERTIVKYMPILPGYFHALEIPLRRGREFAERDTKDSQRVAIIDENLARRFWPGYPAGQDPIGQRLLVGATNPKPAEIVGVVANVHQTLEDAAWPDSVYVALAQGPQPFAMLAVRTTGDPLSFTRAVRAQVQALDPDQPITDVQTMDELVEAQVGERRVLTILLGSFAGVALLLALIGIYGIIAGSVAQRTQEMGIRRALGAQQSDILRLVVGQGLAVTLWGVAAGLLGAFAVTRVLTSRLFHVSATDPATFIGVALLFLLVALGASYIPARRASRIDPVSALRV
jgi:predicted permease